MATTRNPAPPADPPQGISPEQRTALDAYVTELAALGGPPPPPPAAAPPTVSDDQWANFSDRQRENWVSNQVGWILDELAKLDADHRRDAEIEALKAKKPEPEASPADNPPGFLQKVQTWLWGSEPEKS